jgi:hypothetical protein
MEEDQELRSVISWVRSRAYDSIAAIDQPQFVSGDRAVAFLRPGDEIIGVSSREGAKAYPVQFLNGREVVNDSLGGVAQASSRDPGDGEARTQKTTFRVAARTESASKKDLKLGQSRHHLNNVCA